MNLDIKKRIDSIANPEAISFFFNLLQNLITELSISADDARLAINVRNDSPKRFSVNINSRLVLSIKEESRIAIMINNEDLNKVSNIPSIKIEDFDRKNPAKLIYYDFGVIKKNIDVLKPLWLRSCKEYLPMQVKSQYRKSHIEELFKIAIDEKLLLQYQQYSTEIYSNFHQIITDFKEYIKSEDSLLKEFDIQKIYKNYVWISDAERIIGQSSFCHYELITRDQYPNKIWIELHFDKSIKKKIKNLLSSELGTNFKWNPDHLGGELSLALQDNVDFNDSEILSKLENGLVQIENTFGNKIREFKTEMSYVNVKKEFVQWMIDNDGEGRNYFSKQFGSNKIRFGGEIDKYEDIYKQDFHSELFLINKDDLTKQISTIKNNVYSNSPGFVMFSKNNNNGRPKAILGNKNYIAFLENYFVMNTDQDKTVNNNNKGKMALNQILYGPPGTGKTYHTINKAVSIIESKLEDDINSEERDILKGKFDDYVKNGQIAFTTFHQSMSYEDFIEGIKPHTKNEKVTYSIEDGVFKSVVKRALIEYIRKDSDSTEPDDFDTLYSDFVNSIKSQEGKREGTFTTKTGVEIMLVDANESSIQIKYLWSNKKKDTEGQHTFSVTKEKLKRVLLEGIEPSKVKSLLAELHPIIGHIHCELFAVYKSFYDFVIANKGEIEMIHFDYEEMKFEDVKEQYDLLSKEEIKSKTVKPYVIIIDEINRGNVSQIFGELITLIEEDKRLGNEEALQLTLAYSKKEFGIPPNVFIIGTMNTADRSVEALDTALRRRFSFSEMMPVTKILSPSAMYCRLLWDNEDVGWASKEFQEKENNLSELLGVSEELRSQRTSIWDKEMKGKIKDNFDHFKQFTFEGINLELLLKKINERIEVLLDRDHTIGHSYFLKVRSKEDLRETFKDNIIPLLQEYFYGDYEKIGMILGAGFFKNPKIYSRDLFADFPTQNFPESGELIRLKTIDKLFDIVGAIKILMKKK